MFEKLGYIVDEAPEAREYADEPGDVTLSLDRATFVATAPSSTDPNRDALG